MSFRWANNWTYVESICALPYIVPVLFLYAICYSIVIACEILPKFCLAATHRLLAFHILLPKAPQILKYPSPHNFSRNYIPRMVTSLVRDNLVTFGDDFSAAQGTCWPYSAHRKLSSIHIYRATLYGTLSKQHYCHCDLHNHSLRFQRRKWHA
jgi:hypothetical protein